MSLMHCGHCECLAKAENDSDACARAARRVAHAAPPHNMTRGVHSAHRDTPHPNITPRAPGEGG
jgi:hypothetical protein